MASYSDRYSDLSAGERAWLEFIRMAAGGRLPRITLRGVQALQEALRAGRAVEEAEQGRGGQGMARFGSVGRRIPANLGRLDQITPERLDPLINGLNRALGRAENMSSEVIHEPGRGFGDVFALHELWRELGIDTALKRALRSSRREIDAEALIRAMVFNRLCDPTSKLGCLRWLDTVAIPAMPETVAHQHLLRTMDALMDHAETVEEALVLYRVMRMRLRAKGHSASPRTALDLLARIQKHTAHIGARTFNGTSTTTPEQLDLFDALSLPKPVRRPMSSHKRESSINNINHLHD